MPARIIARCNKGFDPRPYGQNSIACTQPVFDLEQDLRYIAPRLALGGLCKQGGCGLTNRAGVNFHSQVGNPLFPVQIKTDLHGRAADGRTGVALKTQLFNQGVIGKRGGKGQHLRRVKLGSAAHFSASFFLIASLL